MLSQKAKIDLYITQIDVLIDCEVHSESNEFLQWKINVERLLATRFGQESYEFQRFSEISFDLNISSVINCRSDSEEVFLKQIDASAVRNCREGLLQAKNLLQTYQADFEEDEQIIDKKSQWLYSKVFIVHGHNGELKHAVARIIEKQNIKAVILSEKENQGKTIIEKIEKHSDVGGAICLFTKDDLGKEKNATKEQSRARQNVVFEAGFFMGKLGRDHVVLLADQGIEMPSDLSGVVYTNTKNWELDLLKELKAMGYNVDLNKLYEG